MTVQSTYVPPNKEPLFTLAFTKQIGKQRPAQRLSKRNHPPAGLVSPMRTGECLTAPLPTKLPGKVAADGSSPWVTAPSWETQRSLQAFGE